MASLCACLRSFSLCACTPRNVFLARTLDQSFLQTSSLSIVMFATYIAWYVSRSTLGNISIGLVEFVLCLDFYRRGFRPTRLILWLRHLFFWLGRQITSLPWISSVFFVVTPTQLALYVLRQTLANASCLCYDSLFFDVGPGLGNRSFGSSGRFPSSDA